MIIFDTELLSPENNLKLKKMLASVVKSSYQCLSFEISIFYSVSVLKEPNKDIQRLLKPSSSGNLSKEVFHSPAGGEEEAECGLPGHTASLLHIAEKRREYPEEAKRR